MNKPNCCEKCYGGDLPAGIICKDSACECHKMLCSTTTPIIEKLLGEFDEKFAGRIYLMKSEPSPIGEHLAVTRLKEQYHADHVSFLKSALEEAYEEGRNEESSKCNELCQKAREIAIEDCIEVGDGIKGAHHPKESECCYDLGIKDYQFIIKKLLE